ncbi:GNAT family N-acetyltransferase [Aliidiomarina quisquiliarum]|uniref:GNAT family N-acetyltransferase n=1 Tax=Aliidiomarina quisquiliarum TaxID=2938947 RepID=UPI00208FB9A5|nr:GNAT family N-acetyltransferase [Aliidiomarina quisquiliarum]MCO4322673.1 GNAT family N-acetyltransferase [Aliidiomarina quisquiliarum]
MVQNIRPATLADVDALVQLENKCFLTDHLGRRSFRRLINSPSALVLGLFQEHQLQAYILILTRNNSAWWRVYSVAVDPSCRGQGLSRILMEHIIERALLSGAAGVRLEVSVTNQVAYQLYLRLGFEVVDLLPAYYADGQDGYRMQFSFATR